jgi:hypothetical protein
MASGSSHRLADNITMADGMMKARPTSGWSKRRYGFAITVLAAILVAISNMFSSSRSVIFSSLGSVPKTMDASIKKVAALNNIVIWTYPIPPPLDSSLFRDWTNNGNSTKSTNSTDNIRILCAYQDCRNEAKKYNQDYENINLKELVNRAGSEKFLKFVSNQHWHKIQHGINFPHHVQSIVMLSILKLHPRSCVRAMGFMNNTLCSFDDKAKAIFANYDPTNSNAEPPFLEPTLKFPNHYGILTYDSRVKIAKDANSGDEMQTFAGLQFLPYLTDYVDRDSGLPQAKSDFFANAWYGFPSAFPPPSLETIHPVMFSMHMSGGFLKVGQSNIKYFQEYNAMLGPIGARDLPTLAFLQKNGIDSYQSSCFTQMTQMGNFENGQRLNQTTKSKIVVVDVKKNLLPPEVVEQATFYEANMYGKDKESIESRLEYAYDLLRVYASTDTKVLITSRIHAALPASALGVPVIFVEQDERNLPGVAVAVPNKGFRICFICITAMKEIAQNGILTWIN